MPVGCLGSPSPGSSLYLPRGEPKEGVVGRSGEKEEVGRQAERMELMQQTLLIQIFRLETKATLSCSTCQSFSPTCCQTESGWCVLGHLVRTNSQAVWNQALVRAVNSLRFQGYVCPGILVTSTDGESLTVLKECWSRHALAPPPGFRIFRLGLSGGCQVTPFVQGPCPSLSDAICAVLSSLKRKDTIASMENIMQGIQTDFGDIPAPKDFLQLVHKTLGTLIKARKVYYTGKGYFLVMPDKSESRNPSWSDQYHQYETRGQCKDVTEAGNQTDDSYRPSIDRSSETSYNGLTVRQGPPSPSSRLTSVTPPNTCSVGGVTTPSNTSYGSHCTTYSSPGPTNGTLHHSPTRNSPQNLDTSEDSKEDSPRSPIERSQSFRLNKKSQKLATKGGSLRLSKKDAAVFKDESPSSRSEDPEEERDSPTPKKMERKNSVLGRLFGRRKSSNSPKKEILTFNAQFPPPDLIEHMRSMARGAVSGGGQTAETQTPPQRKRSQVCRPLLPTPNIEDRKQPSPPVSTTQVKSGPNGNYVVYERTGGVGAASGSNTLKSSSPPPTGHRRTPLSPNLSMRPLPQSPPPNQQPSTYYQAETKHAESIYNIYSQPNYQQTTSKPLPPAYSSAPPYRPKDVSTASSRPQLTVTSHPPPKPSSPHKQVHFATHERCSPSSLTPTRRSSPSCNNPPAIPRIANSESGSSSMSGPSSLDSVLYDDNLASIEKSNQELEQRLDRQGRSPLSHARAVDTIHNNRHLEQEIIYEENMSDMSRSSSVSTLKPDWQTPDHPSLADLGSIADLSAKFQSLTARKLMAGLSISSIDTLLEVNSDERNNSKLSILNESTETIDFGVI